MIKLEDDDLTNIQVIFERYKNNQGDRDFLILKTAEECGELSAELIQKVLHPTHQGDEQIQDEIGDLIFRLHILLNLYDKEYIYNRIKLKIDKTLKKL